jgi:chromosome segregation ATPase
MKKLIKKYENKEIERYLGALNEMHGETLKGIKEGFMLVNKRFNDVDKRFNDVDKRFNDVDKRFNDIDKKLDSHTEMIGVLMEDTSSIKGDLKKKVDYDEFLSLVKRVQMLESKR